MGASFIFDFLVASNQAANLILSVISQLIASNHLLVGVLNVHVVIKFCSLHKTVLCHVTNIVSIVRDAIADL